jgi:hypothetical protein
VSPSISFRWSFDHRLIPGPPLPVWSGSVGATARNCRAARLVITTQMYREASKPQALPSKRNGLPRGRRCWVHPGGRSEGGEGIIIGDQDFRGITDAGMVWLVFVGEVLANRALGARAIFCRAARADFARSVSDESDRTVSERAVGVLLLGSKPRASAFPWTRHSALIFSIAAIVV